MFRIAQLIPAAGWYAVYARISAPVRDQGARPASRVAAASAAQRASGPVPEFLPLVSWALLVDDTGSEPEQVVGLIVHEGEPPELVLADDPSFLGYAGPGDPSLERATAAPDWRALARQAIADMLPPRQQVP